MNKVDRQYTLSLVHILQNFSTVFCLEDSDLLEEDIIDLSDLEKSIKFNNKIFDKVLEEGDIKFNLKQAEKAYNQVMGYFQILKTYYNNVVANKKQVELLKMFAQQLDEQTGMLKALT